MKAAIVALLAVVCMVGVTFGQFVPQYGLGQQQGSGLGGLLPLLGLLFLLPLLFNRSNSNAGTTFIYGNFSAPTGK